MSEWTKELPKEPGMYYIRQRHTLDQSFDELAAYEVEVKDLGGSLYWRITNELMWRPLKANDNNQWLIETNRYGR